jgi:imidazolonepropionase-like amidohydrolase
MEALHLRATVLPEDEVRDVFVTADGRLSFDASAADARTIWVGGVLVPGLADVHCHLAMASPDPSAATPEEAAQASARSELAAGVLALREPGSPAPRAAVGLGPDRGYPRVFTGGQFVACPGGYVPGFAIEVAADELPDAVVAQSRASGGWAKVVGDWPGPDLRHRQGFAAEALAAAAAAVHEVGGRIAIHAGLPETIAAAIAAGFDSIEHGLAVSDADVDAMARSGVALVPTMFAMVGVPAFLDGMGAPREEVELWAGVVERQGKGVRAAVEAGVRVLAGSDAGMVPHGNVAREIEMLRGAGVEPVAALAAGSWDARAFLGLPGIEHGAPADLVGFARDPREDPSVLLAPALVILDGAIVRAPEPA